MKKKENFLNKFYTQNSKTKNFIIEVSLDKYLDVFNEWDPAPYKRRDLDPDLVTFLEYCSFDIPFKYGIDIAFQLSDAVKDEKYELEIITGFRNYYSFKIETLKKELKKLNMKTMINISISFIFLFLFYFLKNKINDTSILHNALLEGIYIGGWVFAWDSISEFFFNKAEKLEEIKTAKRLRDAEIIFEYSIYN